VEHQTLRRLASRDEFVHRGKLFLRDIGKDGVNPNSHDGRPRLVLVAELYVSKVPWSLALGPAVPGRENRGLAFSRR